MLHKTFIRLVVLIILAFSTLIFVMSAKKCNQEITSGKERTNTPVPDDGDYFMWESLGNAVLALN